MDHLQNDKDVDPEDVVKIFKILIVKSYGKRTADGKFIKSERLTEEFAASDAYSELFLKFIDNTDNFAERFMEGILEMSLVDAKKSLETVKIDNKPAPVEATSTGITSDI